MNQNSLRQLGLGRLGLSLMALLLVVAVACGTAAPEIVEEGPTPATTTGPATSDAQPSDAQPTEATTAPQAPTVTPAPTPEADAVTGSPSGALNMGQKETGPFAGHPRFSSSPRIQFVSASIGEGLFRIEEDLSASPLLAQSWSISEDFTTWTFNLQPGVQFHKGYGEMTAEDVIYSYEQWAEGSLHARAGFIREFWDHADGSLDTPDPHTIIVNTGVPWIDSRVYEFMRTLGGSSTWIVSKQQSEEIGAEAADQDTAATGPWEIVEHQTAQFWKFEAVEDHWRQTPHFQELIFWEIPEESSRVAGFQTGNLDTFDMAFDSIPQVEQVEGARLVNFPNAGQMGVNIYGQLYTNLGTPDQYEAYDPNLPWVSASPDTESQEWEDARKVREAMAISIDREAIVDTLLSGFGAPLAIRDWAGHEQRMPEHWEWEYNPDRARELLGEAGYPDGFTIDLVPAIRGAPAEVEACEAMGAMWSDIGIDVNFQRIPYATIRPSLINRKYLGVTCHAVSIRLAPIIGLSNYVTESVFSYGTEHPWMQENITAALGEVDPAQLERMEVDIYDWMFRNVMNFGLYSFDAVWPLGPRVEEWQPVDYSEVRIANGLEYARHRK
jgi:ABC-type transport system substrate-binding protein